MHGRRAARATSAGAGVDRVLSDGSSSPTMSSPQLERRRRTHAHRLRTRALLLATTTSAPFEPMSKRRKGFPSETRVKRGHRAIKGGEVELVEKLGDRDPCPCG